MPQGAFKQRGHVIWPALYVDVDSDLTKEVGRADQIVSIHV